MLFCYHDLFTRYTNVSDNGFATNKRQVRKKYAFMKWWVHLSCHRLVLICMLHVAPGLSIMCENCLHTLQWRHNRRDGISNHQPHDCLLNRLFQRRSKKISKLPVTGLCAGNSSVTGEFSAQMASKCFYLMTPSWWRPLFPLPMHRMIFFHLYSEQDCVSRWRYYQ